MIPDYLIMINIRLFTALKRNGPSGLNVVISGKRDRNVPPIVVSASQTADRRDISVPLLRFQILLLKSEEPKK